MRNMRYRKEKEMCVQIGNWLYQNAMAIFISAIASLLISKRYYDQANREKMIYKLIRKLLHLRRGKNWMNFIRQLKWENVLIKIY